jgi:SAM-dependent methyltransferase
MKPVPVCRICAGCSLERIGTKHGHFARRDFELQRCLTCGYAFVLDPWLDYEAIYSEAYYRSRGADAWVNYVSEWEHPATTVRQYEWRGVLTLVEYLRPFSRQTAWLDFGAGMGGLVRYVRERRNVLMFGHEPSSGARRADVPFLSSSELDSGDYLFDIVTAIEVLEHTADPLTELQRIRALLKPGGLFFYTTGNAEPHRNALLNWRYFIPEIHISLYEPRTLAMALERTGFRPEFRGFLPGFADIIRFKVLKNLRVRHAAWWERSVPWPTMARLIDRWLGIAAHPIGFAP